jgi:hypothetical protein
MMLWLVALGLFILWVLGFVVFKVTGAIIHLLLIVAVIILAYRFFTGRKML